MPKRGGLSVRGHNQRSQRGSMAVFAVVSLLVLFPLGLLSYEVVTARQQYNQLKAATDAAALAASTYLRDALNSNAATAEEVGLTYFKKNRLLSNTLAGATLSDTAITDSPPVGESRFNLTYNSADNTVVAESAFGLEPLFLKFIGTFPLHARSIAGSKGTLTGDVCIVLDLSRSMTVATPNTKTLHFTREYRNGTSSTPPLPPFLSYTEEGAGGNRPAKGADESLRTIPSPEAVDYPATTTSDSFPQLAIDDNTPKLKAAMDAFHNLSPKPVKPRTSTDPPTYVTDRDVELALLVEAKRGNLNSLAAYRSDTSGKRSFRSVLQFIPGMDDMVANQGALFQKDYQRIALACEEPLRSAKRAVNFFVDNKASTDNNFSLVGFGAHAGDANDLGTAGTTLDLTNIGAFRYPIVPLSLANKASGNDVSLVKEAVNYSTVSAGTNLFDGMTEALNQLRGGQHTPNWDRTIVIVTDGCPTGSSPIPKIQEALNDDIKVYLIAFFLDPIVAQCGPRFCKKVKKLGAEVFYIPSETFPLPPYDENAIDQATVDRVKEILEEIMAKITSGPGVSLQ